MGSGYFGEPNMGNDHHHQQHERGGSGSSSRKGKKNSSSSENNKQPKQPQRGLGVAQLEKIRLTGQLGCTTNNNTNSSNFHHHPSFHTPYHLQEDIRGGHTGYGSSIPSSSFSYSSSSSLPSYGYNPNIMMGVGDYERTNNIGYGVDSQPSTIPSWNLGSYESHHQHSLQPGAARHLFNLHETTSRSKKHRSDSIGSSSQNSESSDSQELDLELRLSL
ncbi:unnamed protein product [Linum tenue]|uniref:Uncharacterized protein n=1 Tax=Linum tenue TaxID=586396 RepID=A0AAV0HYB6_9ROSI|nr:unnamed protein product [Linum tenue]